MFKGSDFVLNPEKLEKEFQLVEISEWVDYHTKEKLGFHYSVILPKLRFEKLKVSVKCKGNHSNHHKRGIRKARATNGNV